MFLARTELEVLYGGAAGGGKTEALLMAASAIHDVRLGRYADGTDEDTAAVAAASLVQVICELERLRDASSSD